MRRASNLLIGIGLFLVVSLLWPYSPEEPATSQSRFPTSTWTPRGHAGFQVLESMDGWEGKNSWAMFDGGFSFPLATGYREQTLRLPSDLRIPPGARWLNVSVETEALDGTHPPIDLWFTTANDLQRLVQLRHDVPVSTRIADEWTDWTEDPNTRWKFVLGTNAVGYVNGQLRIEVSRDGPLPPDVLLADRWRGADQVRIFEQRSVLWDLNPLGQSSAAPAGGSQPNAQPRLRLQPALGVEQLVVTLRYNSSTPTQFHYQPFLDYRGADRETTWERMGLPPMVSKPAARDGLFVWKLPVEPRMWDSPFSESTRWDVRVNWYGNSPNSPTLMDGNFQFSIDARRDPPRAAS